MMVSPFVNGRHTQLLNPAEGQHLVGRFDHDRRDRYRAVYLSGRPFRNPPDQSPVSDAVFRDLLATAMRDLPRGFGDQQTVAGRRGDDSPAAAFVDDRVKIGFGVEPEHTQLESVLSFRFAVATSTVAPGFGQQRKNLLPE